MDIYYKSDICHNYMVIKLEEYSKNTYKLNMLLNNSIKGLLKTSARIIDNETNLYYEISSKQSMEVFFEKTEIGFDAIKQFIIALNACIEEIKKHLLDENDIMLTQNMIFWDNQQESITFCYYPNYNKEFKWELKNLIEYLLTKLNHNDKNAVLLAYEIQKISLQENYTLNDMINQISKMNNFSEEWEEIQVDSNEELNIIYDKEMKETGLSITTLVVFTLISIGILIGLFIYSKFIYNQKGFLLLAILIGGIIAISYKKSYSLYSQTNLNTAWMQESNEQPSDTFVCIQSNIENTMVLDSLEENRYPYLELVGEDDVKIIELTEFPFVIGKAKEKVNSVIEEASVSRIHARITKTDLQYFIEDLNSTNGTYVNEERIEVYHKMHIKSGDIIKFARIPYRFN